MTIFNKIINREIPATIVYEDQHVLAFEDIQPVAPIHILIIPKKSIASLSNAQDQDTQLLGELLQKSRLVAHKLGIDKDGYRVVINNGNSAGQTVDHLHLHLIGGKPLGWPPYSDVPKVNENGEKT